MSSEIPTIRFTDHHSNDFPDWQEKTLGNLTRWASGGTPAKDDPSFWDGDIPWMSAASMHERYYGDSPLKINEAGLKNGSKIAKKGTLLLLVRGSMLWNRIPVGITTRDVAFNQDVKALAPIGEIQVGFLLQWFMASENMLLHKVVGTGIGAGKLDTDETKSLLFRLPSLNEQTKIVEFLTAVDGRIQQLIQKKALLENYKKGVMQQLFTQTIRFKDDHGNEFPGWEEKKLGEVGRVIRGSSPRPKGDSRYYGGSVPRLMVQDVTRDGKWVTPCIDSLTEAGAKLSRPCPAGTLTIVCSGTVGVVSFLAVDACIHDGFLALVEIDEKTVTKDFLFQRLNTLREQFEKGATHGGVFTNLTTSEIKEFEFDCPSPDEQTKIADFLSAIDRKIESVATQITETQTFKRGLLQQMFV